MALSLKPLTLLEQPTRYMFFTGKGGVGKTSLSTAVALYLADSGKKVLLVSTDTATNLDEMLGVELKNTPVPVPQVPRLTECCRPTLFYLLDRKPRGCGRKGIDGIKWVPGAGW